MSGRELPVDELSLFYNSWPLHSKRIIETSLIIQGKYGEDYVLPLHDVIREQVIQSGQIQADESPIRILDKDKKKSVHQGYYWLFHSPH